MPKQIDVNGGEYMIDYPPLVEGLLGNRCRIDTGYVVELCAFLMVLRLGYQKLAAQTLRGLTGRVRLIKRGQVEWAKMMCEALDEIVRAVGETVDMADFCKCREAIEELTTQPNE